MTASPDILDPANHKMVPVTVTINSTDNCNTTKCRITRIQSNEPQAGTDAEDIPGDWLITGPNTAELRAERAEAGAGRIYTIRVECEDASGNTSVATTTVTVPKSKTRRKVSEVVGLEMKVVNNPSQTGSAFKILVRSNDKVFPIQLNIKVVAGQSIETVSKVQEGATVQVGAFYRPGLYFAEVTQHGKRVVIKLLKQ